jgi:tetratricopeptide (TPR) repeat protein
MDTPDSELESLRNAYAADTSNRDAAVRLAQRYSDIGWYTEADEIYQGLVKNAGEDFSILLDYGNLCFKRGNLDDASRIFTRLTGIKPGRVEGWNNLGIVHLSRQDSGAAEKCFSKVLEIEPENCGALLNMGNYHDRRGEYTEAISMFERAVASKRDFVDGWFNLGNAYLNAKNYPKAAESYRRALRISPDFPSAMKNLGYACEQMGDLDEAQLFYGRALEYNKTDAMLYVNLASINTRLKKYDKARDLYLKAMQLSPREPAGWLGLRQLSILKGDIPTYIKSTLAVLRKLDNSSITESLRCLRELKCQSGVEAILKLADKLEISGDGIDAERLLAYNSLAEKESECRAIYRRLLALASPPETISLCMAEYEFGIGKYEKALGRIERTGGDDSSGVRLKWMSLLSLGRTGEAEKIVRDYLSSHSDCFDAWFTLAGICADSNRNSEAKECLVMAMETGFTDMDSMGKYPALQKIFKSIADFKPAKPE